MLGKNCYRQSFLTIRDTVIFHSRRHCEITGRCEAWEQISNAARNEKESKTKDSQHPKNIMRTVLLLPPYICLLHNHSPPVLSCPKTTPTAPSGIANFQFPLLLIPQVRLKASQPTHPLRVPRSPQTPTNQMQKPISPLASLKQTMKPMKDAQS